ncbi:unnamed protein product [Allacma fusca]|uniref:Uncharacterized protein n=1 Tax=Allacma fusca TaxID=39272 RepID=A0A8J2P760_9HEXA|nr:unnamed protein product [Allacma fusca]
METHKLRTSQEIWQHGTQWSSDITGKTPDSLLVANLEENCTMLPNLLIKAEHYLNTENNLTANNKLLPTAYEGPGSGLFSGPMTGSYQAVGEKKKRKVSTMEVDMDVILEEEILKDSEDESHSVPSTVPSKTGNKTENKRKFGAQRKREAQEKGKTPTKKVVTEPAPEPATAGSNLKWKLKQKTNEVRPRIKWEDLGKGPHVVILTPVASPNDWMKAEDVQQLRKYLD